MKNAIKFSAKNEQKLIADIEVHPRSHRELKMMIQLGGYRFR
jgi:hypothetical protein